MRAEAGTGWRSAEDAETLCAAEIRDLRISSRPAGPTASTAITAADRPLGAAITPGASQLAEANARPSNWASDAKASFGPGVPSANRALLKCLTMKNEFTGSGMFTQLVNRCSFPLRIKAVEAEFEMGRSTAGTCLREHKPIDILMPPQAHMSWKVVGSMSSGCLSRVESLGVGGSSSASRPSAAAPAPAPAPAEWWLVGQGRSASGTMQRSLSFTDVRQVRKSGNEASAFLIIVSESTAEDGSAQSETRSAFDCAARRFSFGIVTVRRSDGTVKETLNPPASLVNASIQPNSAISRLFNRVCFGEALPTRLGMGATPVNYAAEWFRQNPAK